MENFLIKKHTMITHGNAFAEICSPIFRSTPINYIGLAKIYKNGSRSYLVSDPQWGEILLRNDYHLAGTEDALLMQHDNSHFPWHVASIFSVNEQTQNLLRDCISHNYGNGITLVEHGNEFVEFIHICTSSGHEKVDDYLINNIDLLWNFVLYIREAIFKNKNLKKAYDVQYAYPLLVENKTDQDKFHFKPKQYHLGGKFDHVFFTNREIKCLVLLAQHIKAKEQASIVSLSKRTIETYIEHIKQKTGFKSQSELISELIKNNLFLSLLRNPPSFFD